MKKKIITVLVQMNRGLTNEIANYLNRTTGKVWSYTKANYLIQRWKKANISLKNKLLITEAVNHIFSINYTIQDLEKEI